MKIKSGLFFTLASLLCVFGCHKKRIEKVTTKTTKVLAKGHTHEPEKIPVRKVEHKKTEVKTTEKITQHVPKGGHHPRYAKR